MRHPPLAAGWIDRPHRRARARRPAARIGRDVLRRRVRRYVVHGDAERGPARRRSCVASRDRQHAPPARFPHRPGRARSTPTGFASSRPIALGNGLSSSPSNSVRQPRQALPALRAARHGRVAAAPARRISASTGCSRWSAHRWAACRRCSGRSAIPQRMERVVAMTPMARTRALVAADQRAVAPRAVRRCRVRVPRRARRQCGCGCR